MSEKTASYQQAKDELAESSINDGGTGQVRYKLDSAIKTPEQRRKDATGNRVRERVAIRLHPDTKERVNYWAEKHGVSANEYMAEAVEAAIRRENGDYDLPTLETQRLNQLIDQQAALETSVNNLQTIAVNGFDSLMGLTRGDSYLLDEEDGELDRG